MSACNRKAQQFCMASVAWPITILCLSNSVDPTPRHTTPAQSETAWGKSRWHLRVGFFALDAFLGLLAAVITASLFSTVAKVCHVYSSSCANLQFAWEDI